MAAETKKEPLPDEEPVVQMAPEIFDPTRITMNPNDKVSPDGFFVDDFNPKALNGHAFLRVAIKLPKTLTSYKQLAALAQFNLYRPCPGAVKTTLKPCPAVFGIRIYPAKDCPRVDKLVQDGHMDFHIDPALLPIKGRGRRRAVIKSSTLVAYKTTGLHYPSRLSIAVENNRALEMQNVPSVLTNWDSNPYSVVGTHIEPDQELHQVGAPGGGGCSLGSCDVGKIAWYSRLAGVKDTDKIMKELEALPAWDDSKGTDRKIAKIRIAGTDKADYTFLQWLVGHHWMYCWHSLTQYWYRQQLPVETTEFPVPYQDKDTKETFVPIHRDSVKNLLHLVSNVLRHKGSFDISQGLKLRLAFDKESKAYQEMARERKKAAEAGLVEEFDHHNERFQVCFDIQLEFLTYQVGDEQEQQEEEEEDLMQAQERAISKLSDDAALLALNLTSLGGRARPLRGTTGF